MPAPRKPQPVLDFVLDPLDDFGGVTSMPEFQLEPLDPTEMDTSLEAIDREERGPTTFAGVEMPDMASGIQDMFNGFNLALGQALDTGIAVVGGALPDGERGYTTHPVVEQIKGYLSGKGYDRKPTEPKTAISDAMKALGLTYDDKPVSDLMEDIGAETFQQLLLSSLMIGNASKLTGITGEGTLKNILREMGDFMKKHPMATTVSNIGSGVGAQVGEEFAGTPGEIGGSILGAGAGATSIGPMMGRIAGGTTGMLVGAGAGAMAGFPLISAAAGTVTGQKWGAQLAERALRTGIPVEKLALLGKNLPQEATGYAREIVHAEDLELDDTIRRVYGNLSATANGDAQGEAEALQKAVGAAYEKAQLRAGQLWASVDQSQIVPTAQGKAMVEAIRKQNPTTAPELLPTDIMDKIMGLNPIVGARAGTPPGKAPLPKYGSPATIPRGTRGSPGKPVPATLKDLRGIQMLINGKLRTDPTLTDTTRKYLSDLHDAVDADIAAVNPKDSSLQVAREYTRWLHDKLSRGPLGKFSGAEANKYQQSIRGDLEAAKALIQQSEAGSAIAEVSAKLNMPQLEQEATAFMKQHIAETFSQYGPERAAKLMQSPTVQRFMQAFPKAAAEFNADAAVMSASLADQKYLQQTAFRAYAGKDPQAAIKDLYGGSDKVAKVQEIRAKLMGNNEALRGFKDGMLTEFYGMAGGSPKKMLDMMTVRDFRGMMMEALGPEDMKRLERMAKAGARLEAEGRLAGNRTMLGMAFRYLGSGIARAAGANTIQQTGTAATLGQNVIETLTSAAPARDIFAKAITDPKWERLLYSRVPETLREMQATQEMVKGVIGTVRASRSEDDE